MDNTSNMSTARPRLEGYLYLLHDGMTGLSKIGCTKTDGNRQKAIMGAHSNVLVNVLNAKVADYRAAETQCHRHFQAFRTNGEWFNVRLEDIIEYIHGKLEWLELDFESPGRVMNYLLFCRLGDMRRAKEVLSRKGNSAAQLRVA
jgi:hypothetical protein